MNILITGTRKGLGRAIAEHYLQLGHIVIGCSRSECDLGHSNYHHFELDVSNEKDVIRMVRSVKKEFGVIDALINNAGIASMNHIVTTPLSSAAKVLETNVLGTFILTREVSKLMLKNRSGSIINFSTVAVPLDLEGEAIYAASKSAVESLTRISAKELSPYGIRVNAVGPTPVPTDLIKTIPKHKIDKLISSQALGRLGKKDDVINVIDFFLSPRSEFITGQVIYLGGVF